MTSIPASHRLLLDAQVGVLATVSATGAPQATALWFLFDEADGAVRFSLNTARQKTKNLRTRPEASFLVLDPANPYRTIELRGSVEVAPDDDYAFAAQVGAKYGGVDLRTMDQPGETRVVATLRPRKVLTWGE
ncbi:MAG: PPOX class F420-dependent oxidoreductase [Chloroflexi bacterium]|nr:PPOX class F420-dependent oxidoreductase [Chloroflexota bacterium]